MKRSIASVVHETGEKPIATETDWGKVEAMSDEDIEAAALADPDARPLTEADVARMRRLVNVKKLRERIGLNSPAATASRSGRSAIGSSAASAPMRRRGPISTRSTARPTRWPSWSARPDTVQLAPHGEEPNSLRSHQTG